MMTSWMRIAVLLALAVVAATWWTGQPARDELSRSADVESAAAGDDVAHYPSFLPPEAVATLRLIDRGGPFPYSRDGTVFQNREGRLPTMPRGYYREYTVATPGSPDRGARRIVAGGQPPEVFYYTDDHYRSFRRLEIGQ